VHAKSIGKRVANVFGLERVPAAVFLQFVPATRARKAAPTVLH
jgi:hypothetical protein